MKISDETLMAFADGELDGAERAAVEVAMREDPELEKRVARHRALRNRLQSGFADELSEPVPQRLLALVREAPAAKSSNVVDLQHARTASARAAKARASSQRLGADRSPYATSWRQSGSIAAGVLLGLGIGYGIWSQGGVPIVRGTSGALVANGPLASALSSQLTADQSKVSGVHMGLSYLAKYGEYCRTFTLDAAAASGIACRDHQQWQIKALTQSTNVQSGEYRTAATGLSPFIGKLIEEQIQGEPLDAAGESSARQHEWQSPK